MFSIAGKITKIYTVQKRLNIKVLVNYLQKQWVLKGNGKHSLVCPRPESDKKKSSYIRVISGLFSLLYSVYCIFRG